MTRALIFVDTETTGLHKNADIVELAYAEMDGDIETLLFGVKTVPAHIDKIIKFAERELGSKPASSGRSFKTFNDLTKDQTMVAANPAFDKHYMEARGLFNFHYRMLDIESYAMAVLGLDYVPSMREIYETLRDKGYDIPEPKHTAHSDVAAMRESLKALFDLNPAYQSEEPEEEPEVTDE